MHGTQPWDLNLAERRIRALAHLPGALLPMLHDLHATFGYVDPEAFPLLAEAVNVSRAEVVGVVNFYHDFRTTPPGRHLLQVCRAEACQAMGGAALAGYIEGQLNARLGDTTADGAFTLASVYCLGNCALSPAVMLDGKLYGRVTAERATRLIDEARQGA